jgi:hypothetical protein
VGLATIHRWWYLPRMTTATLITFSAGQASQVTGVTPVMQRDWRRRGFLKSVDGRAEFNALDLGELRIMKLMSDLGVGPASSRQWKRTVAYCLISRALMSPQAYDGAVPTDPNSQDSLRRSLLREHATEPGTYTGEFIPAGSHYKLLKAPRFAIWWNEDYGILGSSLDKLHNAHIRADRPTTPAIFIDVHGAATDLLREAGPLVLCED